MRKYDIKNKRNIAIIILISIILIVVFSVFVERVIVTGKVEYQIETSSALYDIDKNLLVTEDKSTIKKKWNNDYYLKYQDNQIDLGDKVVVYNEDSGQISLYGKYYEVLKGSKVNIISDETIIKSSVYNNFYKLSDRKYLVIDKTIISSDNTLSTSNYLIIELDKAGNATLLNNKVNLKTLSATTIITTNYKFDIANEKLYFNDEKEIDLKKIIGSTNAYEEENDKTNNNNNQENISGNGAGNGNNIIINNITNNTTITGDIITEEPGNGTTTEDVIKHSKRTSIINITPYLNHINVDYVIYDPNNEYISVYLEYKKIGAEEVNTIYLSKDNTSYVLTGLTPNEEYSLSFKYSYLTEDKEVKTTTFSENNITTTIPKLLINVYKVSQTKIYYKIEMDEEYKLDSLKAVLYSDGIKIDTKEYESTNLNNTSLTDNFTINNPLGENIVIRLEDIYFNGSKIDMNVYYKYINPYK